MRPCLLPSFPRRRESSLVFQGIHIALTGWQRRSDGFQVIKPCREASRLDSRFRGNDERGLGGGKKTTAVDGSIFQGKRPKRQGVEAFPSKRAGVFRPFLHYPHIDPLPRLDRALPRLIRSNMPWVRFEVRVRPDRTGRAAGLDLRRPGGTHGGQ